MALLCQEWLRFSVEVKRRNKQVRQKNYSSSALPWQNQVFRSFERRRKAGYKARQAKLIGEGLAKEERAWEVFARAQAGLHQRALDKVKYFRTRPPRFSDQKRQQTPLCTYCWVLFSQPYAAFPAVRFPLFMKKYLMKCGSSIHVVDLVLERL